MYNIVTNLKIISEVKKCRYFKVNLGFASTMEAKNSDERLLNDKDKFAHHYNTQYKTTVLAQGNIGDIRIYVDHYIKDDVLAVYYNSEEFIFDYNRDMVREKGIEHFIGHILKNLETEHEERMKIAEEKKIETEQRKSNPDLLVTSPGSVRYEDIKSWLDKKNKERFENE
jgi:hypothetical protein